MEQTWTILVVDDDPTVCDAVSSYLLGELGANGFIRKPFETDDLTVVLEQVMADVDTVSADRSEPDEFEDDETKSTKDNHFPNISPGAGVHDLNQQPRISPLEQTPPCRMGAHVYENCTTIHSPWRFSS